jgi:2,5-diamino-6-(ribosylamino)-4(3H)-pyrimidinone 5'-phosphate reductase
MNRPRVTVHTMASVDGRIDHFAGDVGLYYELAAGLPQDAVLAGSSTFLAAAAAEGIELTGEDPLPAGGAARADAASPDAAAPHDAPLLVVVDSRGQLTRFAWLTKLPYWRAVLVACSATTPSSHLELLARHGIDHVVVGEDRVDLARLLDVLAAEHGIELVRVDSGGTLNGALLRAGLVDEISLLVAPYAVGGRSPAAMFVADDLVDDAVTRLELSGVERLRGDTIWLRYEVIRATAS